MSLDETSFAAAYKEHYTNEAVETLVYAKNRLLAMVQKDENFKGSHLPIPLIYGDPQGRSRTFATAQTKSTSTSSSIKSFVLTRVHDYSIATIANETIEASEGDSDAFMRAMTTTVDGSLRNLTRSAAIAMYGDGYGSIGKIATIPGSAAKITLTVPEQVTNFEVGMDVQFAPDESTALRNSAGTLTVFSVDRAAATVTFTANVSTNSGTVVNDLIFVAGDRDPGASPVLGKIAGLAAWLPYGGASATSFFGVDRSVDTRLSGQYIDGTVETIEEGLIDLATQISREGGMPDFAFMNHKSYAVLAKSLATRVRYVNIEPDTEARIMFPGIQIDGPDGPITCISDQNCPSNFIYLLQMDTWTLYSLGKLPKVIDTDGLPSLRQASADGIELRHGYYGNLGCRAPGFNGVLKVA